MNPNLRTTPIKPRVPALRRIHLGAHDSTVEMTYLREYLEQAQQQKEIGVDTESDSRDSPVAMTDKRTFIRTGGLVGLASGIAILASSLSTFVTASVARPDGPSDLAEFFADVDTSGYGFHLYGWSGLIGLVLAVPFTYGLFLLVRGALSQAWLGAVFMWAGLVVLFPAYVLNILVATKLSSLFGDLSESAANSVYVVYEAYAGSGSIMFLFGSLLTFSIAPWLLSIAWLRTGTRPRWIGWLGVFAGVTGLAWAGLLSNDPGALGAVWAVNAFANIIWMIAAAATMTRFHTPTEPMESSETGPIAEQEDALDVGGYE